MRMNTLEAYDQWESGGDRIHIAGGGVRVFVKDMGAKDAIPAETLLLLHGFPESSFSFHSVLDGLSKHFKRIVVHDMPGYGMSDKPLEGYTYSLFEQADVALQVWQSMGVSGGHLLAHDMGVSVATELLARRAGLLLPAWFESGFQSVTLTNGSLVLDMAKLRITQKLLLSGMGSMMSKLVSFGMFRHQIRSAHGNDKLDDAEIRCLWEAVCLQKGHRKSHLTIRYLNDRKRFEKGRWLPALAATELPIHLCWGADDAVARVAMAHHLKEKVCRDAELTVMEGVGHFGQLGSPEKWLEGVGGFYKGLGL